ncbi:MAG: EF-hand domain-containing protein [Sphingomonas sp.]|nr:EF-hand domain-containing protein [Sphingomonas sp.]
MQPRIFFVLAIALGAAEPSLAQSRTSAPASSPAQAQPLGRATFIATMDEEFRKMDSNRDGLASRGELEAHQHSHAVRALEDRARATFAGIDADRNGQISMTEFLRATARPANRPDVTGTMARLDANRDQKVTLVEYRTLTLTTFDRLDADKDGVVSPAEQRSGGLIK